MSRRPCIIASLVSALLCVAGLSAWISSERYTDAVVAPLPHGHDIGVLIDRGTLAGWIQADYNFPGRSQWMHRKAVGIREIDLEPGAHFGFAVDWEPSEKAICMPLWFVSLAGLLGFGVLARLARRRPASGLCSSCGYDLRASKVRCPECGVPISAHAEAVV